MTIDEYKKGRKIRLQRLHEALDNLPEMDDKAHGEVDATTMLAKNDAEEKRKMIKDAFKEKNKEAREFIKEQDKATGASEEDKSEKKLFLDESLFLEARFVDEGVPEEQELEEAVSRGLERVSLTTSRGTPLSLSNVLFLRKSDEPEFKRNLLSAKNAAEFKKVAERDTGLTWDIVEDGDRGFILAYKDRLGNKDYLTGYYSKGATDSNMRLVKQILLSNGIAQEKVDEVAEDILTALGIA